MLWIFEDGFGFAGFYDLAAEHDGDAIAEAADDAEIVRDEDERHVELGAETAEFAEDLGLDRDIQRGGGLVGDEQAGTAGEGHGDHGALLHAATELVRVIMHAFLGINDADGAEPLGDFRVEIFDFGPVEADALGDLAADGKDGVERGGGLLENIRDPAATHGTEFGRRHREDVATLEVDRATGKLGGRRGKQAGEREGGDAFAAAALADDGERAAVLEREGDAFHRFDETVFGAEID